MLHGDLSSTVGTTVAFRCVGTLLKCKEGGINKFLNAIYGKIQRADVDEHVYPVMEYLYRHTEVVIDLVLLDTEYTEKLEKYLADNFAFNRILVVRSAAQISSRLNTGDISYYVDNNDEFRSQVNNKYAVDLIGLSNYIQISGKRGRKWG